MDNLERCISNYKRATAISQFTKDSNFQLTHSLVFIAKIGFWIACIVFEFLCLIPTAYLPSGLFDWWDKAQHVFAFSCLSTLGIFAYRKSVGMVVIGLLLYGGLIEVLQWLMGWRSGEIADWMADGIGILIGSTLMQGLIRSYKLR